MRRREPTSYAHIVLGKNIRSLRQGEKCSQKKLAEMIGVNRSYISEIERGIGNASFDKLLKIAEGLGVSVIVLLDGLDEYPPKLDREYGTERMPRKKRPAHYAK